MRAVAHVVTRKTMTSQFFSLVLRRTLFILVGKSNLGNAETWYNRVIQTFGRNKNSPLIGKFFHENVNANLSLQKTIRHEGASTLCKSLELSKLELIDLINACADRTAEEIQDLVDSKLYTRDLILVVDATYVSFITFLFVTRYF